MQHIPQGETRELELLPFDDALRLAQEPAPDYDVSRWLYVPKVYSEYRYILGTRGKKPLICMGINPSTAIPDRLDNTLSPWSASPWPMVLIASLCSTSTPSGPPIQIPWSAAAMKGCTKKTYGPSNTFCP